MLQQVQAIPYFQLLKGAPFAARRWSPRNVNAGPHIPLGMTFNEFYCQANGSHLNAGSDQNANAKYTSVNGGWNNSTLVYTPADGVNPVDFGVKPGDWISVYNDGATFGVGIFRISQVQNAPNGVINCQSGIGIGTGPSLSATARTAKVGGALLGPNAVSMWPLGQSFASAFDVAGNLPRLNLKNDKTYLLTNTFGFNGGVMQGYTSAPGDGGKAVLDANNWSPAGACIGLNAQGAVMADVILANTSAANASNHGFAAQAGFVTFLRCVVHNVGGSGFTTGSANVQFIECEAYDCGKAAGGSINCGMQVFTANLYLNCYVHDNGPNSSGQAVHGFQASSNTNNLTMINCIADSNSGYGLNMLGNPSFLGQLIMNCYFYNNGMDGIRLATSASNPVAAAMFVNCNFLKNRGYGINIPIVSGGRQLVYIYNCGFGNGNQANLGGKMNLGAWVYGAVSGTVEYAVDVTPWVDPVLGNFTINLPAAITTGRGVFTQTGTKFGTLGYPDVGAAQAPVTTIVDTGASLVGGI